MCERKGQNRGSHSGDCVPSAGSVREGPAREQNHRRVRIVAELTDQGDTDIFKSAGFARVLRRIERSGAQTVIVASATSFAPDTLVQAVGRAKLSQFGITLIAVDGDGFASDLVTTQLVERVLDQASAFDDLLRAAQARGTNERLRRKVGPNWRKQYVDLVPDAVRMAKSLYEMAQRAGTRITLREISAQLAEAGHAKKGGKPFHPQEIDRMIKGPQPRSVGSKRRMIGPTNCHT